MTIDITRVLDIVYNEAINKGNLDASTRSSPPTTSITGRTAGRPFST